MLKITIANSPAELDALQPVWEELYGRTFAATFFQKFCWNRLAAELFREREWPYVLCVQNDNGAAIIPACIAGGALKFLGEKLFDYPAVLWAGDGLALARAWEYLLDLGLPLRLFGIRRPELAWPANPEVWTGAPRVSREAGAEQFVLQHLRSARLLRRLERLGARVEANVASPALVRGLYERKAAAPQAGTDNLFRDSQRRDFMVAAAELGDPPCQIFRLMFGAEWIAALLSFRDGTTRRCYTTWFDPNWARHSPGAALLYEVTRMSLEAGLECDYMTGTQPYKMRLASAVAPLYQLAIEAEAGRTLAPREALAAS